MGDMAVAQTAHSVDGAGVIPSAGGSESEKGAANPPKGNELRFSWIDLWRFSLERQCICVAVIVGLLIGLRSVAVSSSLDAAFEGLLSVAAFSVVGLPLIRRALEDSVERYLSLEILLAMASLASL